MREIKPNSTATFFFPNTFECNYTAKDFHIDEVETSLGNTLDLETWKGLEGNEIIIEQKACDGYYDIVFTNMYDLDGDTPLRFTAMSQFHFKGIIEPVSLSLKDEKQAVLNDLMGDMDKYINDNNILTSDLLSILNNKINNLIKTDL